MEIEDEMLKHTRNALCKAERTKDIRLKQEDTKENVVLKAEEDSKDVKHRTQKLEDTNALKVLKDDDVKLSGMNLGKSKVETPSVVGIKKGGTFNIHTRILKNEDSKTISLKHEGTRNDFLLKPEEESKDGKHGLEDTKGPRVYKDEELKPGQLDVKGVAFGKFKAEIPAVSDVDTRPDVDPGEVVLVGVKTASHTHQDEGMDVKVLAAIPPTPEPVWGQADTDGDAIWVTKNAMLDALQKAEVPTPLPVIPSQIIYTSPNHAVLDEDIVMDDVSPVIAASLPPPEIEPAGQEYVAEIKSATFLDDTCQDNGVHPSAAISVRREQVEHLTTCGRPVKRPRVFLDAVEVPTLQDIYGKRFRQFPGNQTIEEINEKIKKFKNPLVKKGEALAFSLDTVRDRMRPIGYDPLPISLDVEILSFTVTRYFMSYKYGGSPVDTFPKIRQELLEEHGLNDFMYPNLDMNPFGPQMPGSPGLFFVVNEPGVPPEEDPKTYRIISRLDSGIWQYQGQYKMGNSPPLTKQEWISQKHKVRMTWAKEVLEKGWASNIRTRIALRQSLGRQYTPEELAEEYAGQASSKGILTVDAVDQAFCRGEESIAVYTLKCVDYDVQFQLDLVENFPKWDSSPQNTHRKKGQPKRAKGGSRKKKPEPRVAKRKRPLQEEEEEEFDTGSDKDKEQPYVEDADQDLNVEAIELVYIPRGTRSRPIVL